ncbi:discoidin domain-containing protein [Verrucomicrobiaceae bacterium R5-34]|nr:discoidin domain-containing protein [Verrucomicrobiaceae bacterium R5-34]
MTHRNLFLTLSLCTGLLGTTHGDEQSPAGEEAKKPSIYGTITESTPSIPEYFSWINNTNEGATEAQTITNLEFFKWLHDEYGMQLGIYAWDAGNIDSAQYYGSMDTEKFKKQFPNGWSGIADLAKSFSCRMGLWGGPDGFGDTPEEEQARIDLLVSLCRDYELQLFKFDAVGTQLRTEKQDAFAKAMMECRKYAPDLVVLNHRLNLGHAKPHATTFLWGGQETYIDVHIKNTITAPHNRAGAMSRGLPPELKRLTEDHGVCISSCLDNWEDDLILQAFNRNLILAPQIYGNPWLLRDDELAKMSRIFNLHYRSCDILVKGMVLPEEHYGPHAVSRGDGATRYLALRNLTWQPVKYQITLNEEIGLTEKGSVEVRRYHPSESILGEFDYGKTIEVEVQPFRSYLLMASAKDVGEIGVTGADYEVVRDTADKPAIVKVLGLPGSTAKVSLKTGDRQFTKAFLNDQPVNSLLNGDAEIKFPGEPVALPAHKKLADLKPVAVPADAEQLYEATCYTAENNALEVQSLKRSGVTQVPQVQKARDAFFEQELFWRRGIWDKYMFDGKLETFFSTLHYGRDKRLDGGALRIDFGQVETVDSITMQSLWQSDKKDQPATTLTAEVSQDLKTWKTVTFTRTEKSGDKIKVANIGKNGGTSTLFDTDVYTWKLALEAPQSFRYMRVFSAPDRVAEMNVAHGGKALDSSNWHVTHLFAPFSAAKPIAAWEAQVEIESNAAEGSYICVGIEGVHGQNKAFAALRVDGQWVGAPQRAPSFPCVAWEYPVGRHNKNNTYFFPVTDDLRGKKVEVVVLSLTGGGTDLKPHAWVTTHQAPREAVILRLEK